MTIGAFNSPLATISLNASPARWRSPSPSQQMRAGNPWNAMRSPARSSQRASDALSGKSSRTLRSVFAMSSGSPDSATQRNGPLPSQNSGRMYAGTKPGKSNALRDAFVVGDLPDVVAVVERRDAARVKREHRLDVPLDRLPRGRDERRMLVGIALAPPATARRSSPPAGSRRRDRARTSGRSPCAVTVRPAPRDARAPAGSRPRCRASPPTRVGATRRRRR